MVLSGGLSGRHHTQSMLLEMINKMCLPFT
uniref:Uncharacterized protein n=1 Tax=Rhizophora mucronata TaxID=61149 RepID=A0A2P2IIJ0_RHIMU